MPVRKYQLFLMIYFGRPTDDGYNRHVALFFQSPDKDAYCHVTYHVRKAVKLWEMEKKEYYNALGSINVVAKFDLGIVSIDPDEYNRGLDGMVEVVAQAL